MSQSTPPKPDNTDTPEDGLLARFRDVKTVFRNRVVAKPNGQVFHRLTSDEDATEPTPACSPCSKDSTWYIAAPETLRRSGLTPCQSCYQPIFEYLSCDPDSPVQVRTSSVQLPDYDQYDVECETATNYFDDEEDLFEPLDFPSISALSTLTEEVLVQTGTTQIMHAPTTEGPHCGQSGDFRSVNRQVVESHYRPCKDCFDSVDE